MPDGSDCEGLIPLPAVQAQQDPIIQLRPGDRNRNAIAGKGSIGDRPSSMGGAIERPLSVQDHPVRPPSRPGSSRSTSGPPSTSATPNHPFGSPPFDPHMTNVAGPAKPPGPSSLGSRRGSEDLNLGPNLGPNFSDGRAMGLEGAFQDPQRDGSRPFGMGMAAGGTTESMLRDIWARPLAGPQSQPPLGAGAGGGQTEPNRNSITSDFRAMMGVGRQGSGPFAGPFGSGTLPPHPPPPPFPPTPPGGRQASVSAPQCCLQQFVHLTAIRINTSWLCTGEAMARRSSMHSVTAECGHDLPQAVLASRDQCLNYVIACHVLQAGTCARIRGQDRASIKSFGFVACAVTQSCWFVPRVFFVNPAKLIGPTAVEVTLSSLVSLLYMHCPTFSNTKLLPLAQPPSEALACICLGPDVGFDSKVVDKCKGDQSVVYDRGSARDSSIALPKA